MKFRAGWSDNEIVHVDLAKMAEDCGLAAVALHARTREQGYSGKARWEWIAAIKDAVKIPVIGNGDIRSPEDACAMVAQTGCDAVMIGRMRRSNPWIFRQIEQYITDAAAYDLPTEADRYQMIRTYFSMLVDEELPGCGRQDEAVRILVYARRARRRRVAQTDLRIKERAGNPLRVEEFFETRLSAVSAI